MTPADNNLPEINSGLPEQKDLDELEKAPSDKADFDPKKLNLSLVLAGIFAILLMWYLSAKIF